MMLDVKKSDPKLYLPKKEPSIVTVPAMSFVAVRGVGDPNAEHGAYQNAIQLLYGISYTIKMSARRGHPIDGYVPYVVPPLEGLWCQDGCGGLEIDRTRKDTLRFCALIRLPDFVTRDVFDWAVEETSRTKKIDASQAIDWTYEEGICVQCMHVGPYDTEPETIAAMHAYARQCGYEPDVTGARLHHEIYLSNPRTCPAEKLKTVLRHPIQKR